MANAMLERAVFRLSRLLQTTAAPIVQPAVIAAANAVFFHAPKLERCATMRAVKIKKTEPFGVAEKNEFLSQQSDFRRCSLRLHFFGKAYRPPVAAQHFAGRRTGRDSSHQLVFFFR